MSEPSHPNREGREVPAPNETDDHSQGPNLVVLYSLIALALVVAIGLALLIVFPFYNRR
jgi:hypothetical protein